MYFTAMQTRCGELNLIALDKTCFLFGFMIKGFDALQDSGEAKARVASFGERRAERLKKYNALKSHERAPLHENHRVERLLDVIRVGKVVH